jgi:hypothetical protein
MIYPKETTKDNYLDEVQPLLRKLQKKKRFDGEFRIIKAQLWSFFKKKQYIRFSGSAKRFIVSIAYETRLILKIRWSKTRARI